MRALLLLLDAGHMVVAGYIATRYNYQNTIRFVRLF